MARGVPSAPEALKTFERFTESARQVVVLAQQEARDLGHAFIGTEHLLLGLLREEDGIAARALAALGVTSDATRVRVVELHGRGDSAPTGQIPFTPLAKKSLELALRNALSWKHDYIGAEHILLGVAAADAERLAQLGVDGGRVREEVAAMLGPMPVEGPWDYAHDELSPTQPVDAVLERYRAEGWEIVSVRVERRRKPGSA